jgi:hypothetical protein
MRRSAWLLCLLIALLPLRGMAQVVMEQAPAQPGTVAAEQVPCPLHAAAGESDHDGASVCSLCDVCHSVAMPMPGVLAATAAKPGAAPQPALGLGAGRAPAEGLFRPPR